jgi:hypothetical protein
MPIGFEGFLTIDGKSALHIDCTILGPLDAKPASPGVRCGSYLESYLGLPIVPGPAKRLKSRLVVF